MKVFINETMEYLNKEKNKLNEKANILYKTWLSLKKLRERQKYQSTNVKLTVLRFPTM